MGLALVGMITALLLILPLAAQVANDASARRVEKTLLALPLPEDTEVLASISAAGKLTGNGNGMQYLGAALLESDLEEEALASWYGELSETEEAAGMVLYLEPQEGLRIRQAEHRRLSCAAPEEGSNPRYILYAWGEGIPLFSEMDLRGH